MGRKRDLYGDPRHVLKVLYTDNPYTKNEIHEYGCKISINLKFSDWKAAEKKTMGLELVGHKG